MMPAQILVEQDRKHLGSDSLGESCGSKRTESASRNDLP
jgi:hypothetical protein